ncbi:MAG: heme o synthase [Phototrophicales bacterium]|nr:heme o synthase [Phototrophicales bacterium]
MISSVTTGAKPTFGQLLKIYVELSKMRIVILLCFTTATAMVIAAGQTLGTLPSMTIFLPTLLGGAMAAAGASAINQYVDRDLDAKMTRTSRRPIPSGRVHPLNALLYGLGLIAWSFVLLAVSVNLLSAILAFIGAIYYVVLYTLILKRNTVLNILIGGGAGAFPVLVGWSAITGTIGYEAMILFAIVFYWTPPHSWALALLVSTDYAKANVPMMPVARGEQITRLQMLFYSVQLTLITLLPTLFGFLGGFYLITAALLGAGLIYKAWKLLQDGTKALARSTYKYTTAYLAFLFLAMIVDTLLRLAI